MRLLTNGKPEAVADKRRDARPILQHPYLKVEEKALYASTPYMAVRLPVEVDEGDTNGVITAEALKTARKFKTPIIRADGALTIVNGSQSATLDRPESGDFPSIEKVLPTGDDYGTEAISIAIMPEQLAAMAEAMDATCVRLTFHKKSPSTYAILVEPVIFKGPMPDLPDRDRIVGTIMPARLGR